LRLNDMDQNALTRTPANSKPFRDEITLLRCALSDIESLAETLEEARLMATKALSTGT
jgi:hypothetical protein